MGRGRAKAKQAKVARELKYNSPTPDFRALQQELTGGKSSGEEYGDDDRFDDPYAYDDGYDEYRR
ncbi:hypothetical protein GCM10012275_49750 [Longimycelium tulufanense]|uniref:DUF3073 domain-containing protein n=1 Tax=Longimycelium tulufanense TaxID=907463 RepID=A0A8J3CIP9_9PSEU|nr:DUF3073 domain-containing protein [Longimycelium tulufanense]GGM73184.1 hypothetical protein GCM10012275_49750 [Longimycelium tulufanense]